MSFKQQSFDCRDNSLAQWKECETEYICTRRQIENGAASEFEYRLNTDADDYLNNWYVTRDLMCTPKIDYIFICSLYYIAYGIGIIIFFVPDYFGRKVTMNINLPIYMVATAVVVFSNDMQTMKIATFVLGFFHLKSTCAFTQAVELVADKYKTRTIIMLNAFYFACMVFVGMFYLLIDPDTDTLLTFYLYLGVATSILYIAFIPESPYWLVRNEGPCSKRAIKNLNYIAKFNGSPNLISNDTMLVINESDIAKYQDPETTYNM